MKADNLILWFIVALLLAGMALTLLCAPRQSRHGYAGGTNSSDGGDQLSGTYCFRT